MATQLAPISRIERDAASAQLDELALAHDGEPWAAWKDAVVDWHLRVIGTARAETWIPGLCAQYDPIVEKALSRFYDHQLRNAIERLMAENAELRRKLLGVAHCARFYASGANDTGVRASAALRSLLTVTAIAPPH
jgi:hypothetical protein